MDLDRLTDDELLRAHARLHEAAGAAPTRADVDEHRRVVAALAARGFGHGLADAADALDRTPPVDAWIAEATKEARALTKADRRRARAALVEALADETAAVGAPARWRALVEAVEGVGGDGAAVVSNLAPDGVSEAWLREQGFTDAERACLGEKVAKLKGEGKADDQAFAVAVKACAPDKAISEARVAEAADDMLWVGVRLPAELAAWFPPKPEDASAPHVTLAVVLGTKPEDLDLAERAVKASLRWASPVKVELTDYGEFTTPAGQVVAHMVPRADGLDSLRSSVYHGLRGANLIPEHPGPWKPHVTLAQLAPGARYEGPRPSGSWVADAVEITRGGEARHVKIDGDLREAVEASVAEVRDFVAASGGAFTRTATAMLNDAPSRLVFERKVAAP